MSRQSVTVWATTRLEGWHLWPAAPEPRDYLAARHRHLFHVRVTVPVLHDDRDVEFHDLLDVIALAWQREWGPSSCELIAKTLAGRMTLSLPNAAWIEVDVSEDGEAGATYVHVPDR